MSHSERIIEGALELFLQAGIKSVTMDDIARHLGMSKKTIYQYFSDKNELVMALMRMRLEVDKKEIEEMLSKSSNVIEQLFNMMKCSEDLIAKINPVVMHDLQKYHSDAWKEFQKFKAVTLVSTLENLLTKGIEEGYIRPELDARIIARMRVMQIEAGFNAAIFPFAEFNLWKVQQQMLEHFNYGICTIKGYKLLDQYQNINQE